MNSTGCHFNGASSSSLLFLTFNTMHTETAPYLSRLLIPYRPSCILRSSSPYDILQIPCNNLIFLLLTLSVQLHQLFGTPILTQSILPILNSFRHHLKTHLFKQLLMLPSSKLQSLRFTYVTNGTL